MRYLMISIMMMLCVPLAHAQTIQPSTIDLTDLTALYEDLLTATEDQMPEVEQAISKERLRIRGVIEAELQALVAPKDAEENLDLENALDKQRLVVSSLQQRLQDRRADLTLLAKEETLYVNERLGATSGNLIGKVLITKSYAELLARKLVLDERIDVLKQVLSVQEQRLSQLRTNQRLQRTDTIIQILWYIGIFLAVFWLERIIKMTLITHIPFRRVRYAIMKMFGFVVYTSLAIWLISEIVSEHPTIIAALAIVGAATVISTQDVLKGVIGWFSQRDTVALSERVTIGTLTGDVIDTNMLHTTLLLTREAENCTVLHTGKIVRIPNAQLLSQPVVNFQSTSDFVRSELPVTVARAADWEKAKSILQQILDKYSEEFVREAHKQNQRRMREFYTVHTYSEAKIFTEITERGVLFTLCYPVPIGKKRATNSAMYEEILERLKHAKISIVTIAPIG